MRRAEPRVSLCLFRREPMRRNTQALWREAQWRNVTVVEDLDCHDALAQMAQFIDKVDKGIDIDSTYCLSGKYLAVSAPLLAGRAADTGSAFSEPVCRSGKLQAANLVEFNPRFDEDGAAARGGAAWLAQIAH